MVSTTAVNPCKDKIDAYFDCLGLGFKTCISMSWILSGTLGDVTCETISSSNFCLGFNKCKGLASYWDMCRLKGVYETVLREQLSNGLSDNDDDDDGGGGGGR